MVTQVRYLTMSWQSVSSLFPHLKNIALKGGYRNFFYSFIGLVGHNIWWENSRNGSFGPKNGLKLIFRPQNLAFFFGGAPRRKNARFQGLKMGYFLRFWTLFRSERPVSTIFPPYIMSNRTYERINFFCDAFPLSLS